MYDPNDKKCVEKYSSAVTLSDMEIFIFPELLYSIVLANIMSPLLWKWRKDPWFANKNKMSEYRRILRTKQFIMDRFNFNLDLDTWGLTTKEKELARFSDYIDDSTLAQSNALFGYEGDKYYFDMDIRRHFGLDKYTSNVIPYWKTETLEAMEAFKHKEDYPTSAGECVSLSTLYAAALFVLAGISLEKIHLMATPLHSQNYIDIKDGILTNNRRIVTKNMWFNGTELSAKARRALENEKVTMVANNHGYIHTLSKTATMPPDIYNNFSNKLRQYLSISNINFDTLASFFRQNNYLQKYFQIVHACCGKPRYIEIEKVFHYEHSSKSRIGDKSQINLLHEIDEDELYTSPIPNRFIVNELESFFRKKNLPISSTGTINKLKSTLQHGSYNVEDLIADMITFCRIEPKLPSVDKQWEPQEPIQLDNFKSQEEIIRYLESIRSKNPIADIAFMAFRDMKRAPWKPFLKAALERNPVCIKGAEKLSIDQVAENLANMVNESIYDGTRMAQPDEIWNYNRGDGLEKAICLMNIIKDKMSNEEVTLTGEGNTICVSIKNGKEYTFQTEKDLEMPKREDFLF